MVQYYLPLILGRGKLKISLVLCVLVKGCNDQKINKIQGKPKFNVGLESHKETISYLYVTYLKIMQ